MLEELYEKCLFLINQMAVIFTMSLSGLWNLFKRKYNKKNKSCRGKKIKLSLLYMYLYLSSSSRVQRKCQAVFCKHQTNNEAQI